MRDAREPPQHEQSIATSPSVDQIQTEHLHVLKASIEEKPRNVTEGQNKCEATSKRVHIIFVYVSI